MKHNSIALEIEAQLFSESPEMDDLFADYERSFSQEDFKKIVVELEHLEEANHRIGVRTLAIHLRLGMAFKKREDIT